MLPAEEPGRDVAGNAFLRKVLAEGKPERDCGIAMEARGLVHEGDDGHHHETRALVRVDLSPLSSSPAQQWRTALIVSADVSESGVQHMDNNLTREAPISTLFLDVGGVLLTNGWDRQARARAVTAFDLDAAEMEERHHLTFDTYEEGNLSLDEYLSRVIFYRDRPFTTAQFRAFMFDQSQAHPEMVDLVSRLKERHDLRVVVVSNEGRELNTHRVRTFDLSDLVDVFISSCFVHIRKPDIDIFRLALDISQSDPDEVIYIENTPMFVQVAQGLGIRSILHVDFETTRDTLAAVGLAE